MYSGGDASEGDLAGVAGGGGDDVEAAGKVVEGVGDADAAEVVDAVFR